MVCEAKENMGDSQMSNSILALNQLKQMVKNPHIDHWYEAIDQLLPDYDINTPGRVAAFIAQCGSSLCKQLLNRHLSFNLKNSGK